MNTSLMLGVMDDIMNNISGFFGTLLYGLFNIIFLIMDWLQGLFRSLVGLNGSVVKGVEIAEGDNASYDLVFQLIQTDIVQDVFWSMIICGLILLFVMTFLAIIRNLYQEKQKPVSEFISRAFKALSMYVFVPVTVVLGLAFSNVMLILIDGATSQGKTSMMSNNLFIASAYNANVFRAAENDEERIQKFNEMVKDTDVEELDEFKYYYSKQPEKLTAEDWDDLADIIDQAVAQGLITAGKDTISKYDGWQLDNFYEMFKINYLILLVGGISMIGILFKICWGLVGRIFNLIFEFIMMPVVISVWPMDEGKAFGSWKGEFIKNVTMAYTAIGVLNIYYSILPIVDKLEFSSATMPAGLGWTAGLFNFILKIILQIVGIGAASSLISMANGWFSSLGLGDVVKQGEATKGQLKSTWDATTKPIKGGIQKGGAFVGSIAGGIKNANDNGSGFGGMLKGGFKGAWAGTGIPDKLSKNSILDSYKSGRDSGGKYAGEHISKREKHKQAVAKLSKGASGRGLIDSPDEDIRNLNDSAFKKYSSYVAKSDLGQSLGGVEQVFGKTDQKIQNYSKDIEKDHEAEGLIDSLSEEQENRASLNRMYNLDNDAIDNYLNGGEINYGSAKTPDEQAAVESYLKSIRKSYEGLKANKEKLKDSLKAVVKNGGKVTYDEVTYSKKTWFLLERKIDGLEDPDPRQFYIRDLMTARQGLSKDISTMESEKKKMEKAKDLKIVAITELMKIGDEKSDKFKNALIFWANRMNMKDEDLLKDYKDAMKELDKKAKSGK